MDNCSIAVASKSDYRTRAKELLELFDLLQFVDDSLIVVQPKSNKIEHLMRIKAEYNKKHPDSPLAWENVIMLDDKQRELDALQAEFDGLNVGLVSARHPVPYCAASLRND